MPICEDFDFIGKRLREIEAENQRSVSGTDELPQGAAHPATQKPPADFAEWFDQLVCSV